MTSSSVYNSKADGISVIICCYNSKNRITETLHSLATQIVRSSLQWQVILVDNASSDGTAAFARQVWLLLDPSAPLSIVREPQPGLIHARRRGIATAAFEYILFCDDDNRLCPEYIETVFDTLQSNPNLAACGGQGVAECEGPAPYWLQHFAEVFATGPQPADPYSGKIISLYGAGLAVKKKAVEAIRLSEYLSTQTGRSGASLSSSEDTEMTNALILLGYELKFLPQITFTHFLPASRLERSYLKKMFRVFGDDGPVRNLLYAAITERPVFDSLKSWTGHLMLAIFRLGKYMVKPPKPGGRGLYFSWSCAYIRRLLQMRKNYSAVRENISRLKQMPVFTTPESISASQLITT